MFRLDPNDLSVASFEPAPAMMGSTTAITVATIVETVRTAQETVEQICACMTWVAEDCFGPTFGTECSSDANQNVYVGNDAHVN